MEDAHSLIPALGADVAIAEVSTAAMERKYIGSIAGSVHLEKGLTMLTAQGKLGESLQPYMETRAFFPNR